MKTRIIQTETRVIELSETDIRAILAREKMIPEAWGFHSVTVASTNGGKALQVTLEKKEASEAK